MSSAVTSDAGYSSFYSDVLLHMKSMIQEKWLLLKHLLQI